MSRDILFLLDSAATGIATQEDEARSREEGNGSSSKSRTSSSSSGDANFISTQNLKFQIMGEILR